MNKVFCCCVLKITVDMALVCVRMHRAITTAISRINLKMRFYCQIDSFVFVGAKQKNGKCKNDEHPKDEEGTVFIQPPFIIDNCYVYINSFYSQKYLIYIAGSLTWLLRPVGAYLVVRDSTAYLCQYLSVVTLWDLVTVSFMWLSPTDQPYSLN